MSQKHSRGVLGSAYLKVDLTVVSDARAAEVEFNELTAAQQTFPHHIVSHLGASQPQHLQKRKADLYCVICLNLPWMHIQLPPPHCTTPARKLTCRCGKHVMRSATPWLVTAVRSRQRSCSSRRSLRGGSPASVTWVLLSDSFFNLRGQRCGQNSCGHRSREIKSMQMTFSWRRAGPPPGL